MKHYLLKLFLWIVPIVVCTKRQVLAAELGFNLGHGINTPFLSAYIEKGKLYMDIPKTVLDSSLLWTRIGSREVYDTKQVVFRREGQQILMEEHWVWSETGVWIPLKVGPKQERNVLGVFPVLEEDRQGCRIEITSALLGEDVAWEHRSSASTVRGLSGVKEVRNKGDEVMVKILMGLAKDGAKWMQPVYYSFYRLPSPMRPRAFDHRMAYWVDDMDNGADPTKHIKGGTVRWRLEKDYGVQEPSVPVRPITFLISPEVPKKWRPYVKAGIEEWLPAFESAGFKDAIKVREVDSLDEWSNRSLRHSVVRWNIGQNIRGNGLKRGSTVSLVIDQRSGEIIKSDILFGTSLEHLMDEYFIRCAALDDRALAYPFPDELVGELIQYVIAHETGHALGIRDSHFGEFSYPVERMGDVSWLEVMGHTPSIMGYARHNNIAQPEDNVPPSLLIQKVGPMDHYNIRWGYREFPKGMSSMEKADQLERMVRIQDSVPWFRYNSGQYEVIGPAATNEVVETNDPIRAMSLGLKNLERAMVLLPDVCRNDPDASRLERIYGEALELWYNSMRHVLSLIGGYDIQYKSMGQTGNMFTPIPREIQEKALFFLIKEAFDPPNWLAQPVFMDQIRYSSYPDEVLAFQQLLLIEMLRPQRMKRFEQMERFTGYQGILNWYLGQFQEKLFHELMDGTGRVGRRKQELQLLYIEQLKLAITQQRKFFSATKKMMDHTDYTRGIMMEKLQRLRMMIEREVNSNNYRGSMGHWQLCLAKINIPMDF